MLKRLIAGAVLLSCSTLVTAENEVTYDTWVGGFTELYYPDSDKPDPLGFLDDGHGFGAEFGYRFEPNWAARIEWSNLDLDTQNVNLADLDGTGDRIGVDALYFLKDDMAYLFAGVKHTTIGDSHRMANLGVGKHWKLTDNWRVISEAAVYHDFGESFRDVGFKLGLAYTFGGQTASAKVSPKDSDRDGVYDSKDQCPQTPPGTRVDAQGCNWDKDGDGVANAVDQCPDTPRGEKVNDRGCPIQGDSDGDGVLDINDRCPGTPSTDKVDENGCSIFEQQEVSVSLHVLFDNNSAEINNPDSQQFSDFAAFLARFPNTQATIEGHTSKSGPADYNQTLSEKRAHAVRQLLIDQYGVDSQRLDAVGYGETRLIDQASNAEAHRVNRRIEAKVTAMEESTVPRD